MATTDIPVCRHSLVSTRTFADVVSRLTATIGRPDMHAFHAALNAASTAADLATVVERTVGLSGLMEFIRFDAGEVLRKARGGHGPMMLRLVVGNPLIMQQMATAVPDAAGYAPVTILVDERADGVHLSYDSVASLLAPYGSEPAVAVARNLDAQVLQLLEEAAR